MPSPGPLSQCEKVVSVQGSLKFADRRADGQPLNNIWSFSPGNKNSSYFRTFLELVQDLTEQSFLHVSQMFLWQKIHSKSPDFKQHGHIQVSSQTP